MWKMPEKIRIQTRIVSASVVKRVLDLLSVSGENLRFLPYLDQHRLHL